MSTAETEFSLLMWSFSITLVKHIARIVCFYRSYYVIYAATVSSCIMHVRASRWLLASCRTINKKYVLSNSESVQCNFFIFDHVTFIQFKICCCVQNFIEIWWFFTEIWRYIEFQNGGLSPSWNCFIAIRDNQRSLCCWPQLPVKFHVNLIQRSEDI